MYRDLEQARASDFGAGDEEFEAMVLAGRVADRRFHAFLWVILGANVVLLVAFQVVASPGALVLWLVHRGLHARANRAAKAMGITRAQAGRVRRARVGTAGS